MDDPLSGTVRKLHVREFDARAGKLQRRLVIVRHLGWRVIDHVEQDSHPDQTAAQIQVETCKPLGRFIGQHERGQKREELAGCGSGLDHAKTAVDERNRDGESAERLH